MISDLQAPPQLTSPRLELGRVLLVDDEPDVLYTLKSLLKEMGLDCWTASGGQEGLEILKLLRFDVVIVDLDMPGMPGQEFLERVGEKNWPIVSVILTGFGDVASAVECMQLGAFDFLTKPISFEVLEPAIRKALRHAKSLRRERCLAKVAQEWEATFDASIDLLAVLDNQGILLRCNQAFLNRLQMPMESVCGREFSELFLRGEQAPCSQIVDKVLKARELCSEELSSKRLGGSFLVTAAPFYDSYGLFSGITFQARDITELKRVEKERSYLLQRLFSIQEEERRRISRDLHDSIGQSLMSLILGLNNLRLTKTIEETHPRLSELIQSATNTLQEVRLLSKGLRPIVLDDLGLIPALEQLLKKFQDMSGIEVDYCHPKTLNRLPPHMETVIYRIVQEGLSNVAKHSNAHTVSVVLVHEENQVRLIIEDDGCGFDVCQSEKSDQEGNHLGLISIRERLASLGGVFQIESDPDCGTTLYVTIPFEERIEERLHAPDSNCNS